ncbi:2-succinylbenzoyl-CoA synthetase [Vibrio xiamenensis]|uniref:2-succinylbenzoyl-CoA synthetase n=1 Tax=Vibrio xiamenensis TaxID=861298 RepID=A0A1G7Y5G0_9VIBR|nr:2-succinylbenzoyl-CoA synthetase [Vibrio xiamenensis]
MSLFQQNPIQYWAQQSPFSIALKTARGDYTWAQVAEQVERCALLLAKQGVVEGSVVTLVGKNSLEMLWLMLSCFRLGAISALTMPQPAAALQIKLNTLYRADSRQFVWLDSGIDTTVAPSIQLDQYIETKNGEGATEVSYDAERLATLVFTSGSTGQPKAVAHTHGQHLASAQGLLAQFHFQPSDTWLLSLPMYHVSGLSIVYRWLYAGACLKFASGDLAKDIQGVTHASLVPTQLQRLFDEATPLSLTHVLLGGSHVPVSLANQAKLQGVNTWIGYGMTEAASTVTAKPVNDSSGAGQVLANRRVTLRGEHILIGGATLARGYFYQGKLRSLRGDDGWFESGDLGRWQDDELHIIGRADNLFISGGENIHCEEIEAVLNRHAQIRQAFVVPIKDAQYGARPVAIIDADSLPSPQSLSEFLAPYLVKFKHPDHYFLLQQEFKSTGIKVSRQQLKQWLQATTDFAVMS